MTFETTGIAPAAPQPASAAPNPKDDIVAALLELAGERNWEDISLTEIAARAHVSLSTFRECFPSKGAILSGFVRKIDKEVLDGLPTLSPDEPPKERLFDVLMRRLDVLAPHKMGVEGILEWTARDPLAAAAVNKLMLNSMRFMLEAAGIESEGPVGALKLQGLVIAWWRVLQTWLTDDDPGLAVTMAALDRELTRGGKLIARAEDLSRLTSPLVSIARALLDRGRGSRSSSREHWEDEQEEHPPL